MFEDVSVYPIRFTSWGCLSKVTLAGNLASSYQQFRLCHILNFLVAFLWCAFDNSPTVHYLPRPLPIPSFPPQVCMPRLLSARRRPVLLLHLAWRGGAGPGPAVRLPVGFPGDQTPPSQKAAPAPGSLHCPVAWPPHDLATHRSGAAGGCASARPTPCGAGRRRSRRRRFRAAAGSAAAAPTLRRSRGPVRTGPSRRRRRAAAAAAGRSAGSWSGGCCGGTRGVGTPCWRGGEAAPASSVGADGEGTGLW